MPTNELPVDGDWAAVHAAVRSRLARLDMTTAGLSRASGVSETTIRYLNHPEKRQRSTLVALSAALGFRPAYLEDVLRGRGQEGGGPWLPCGGEDRLDGMAAAIADIGDMVGRMNTVLCELAARSSDGSGLGTVERADDIDPANRLE